MDPIYEAYKQINESAEDNLRALKKANDSLRKLSADTSKKLGVKDKGAFFTSENHKTMNVVKIGKQFVNSIGENAFGISIIEDTESSTIQVIAALGYSDNYESTTLFSKVKDFKAAEDAVRKWANGITARSSASDVNKDASRFKSGRL